MNDERDQETAVQVQPAARKTSGQDIPNAVHAACRVLANTLGLRRIDISLDREAGSGGRMALIQVSKDIAREWGLDSYVRFRDGDFSLTFVKRTSR